MPPVSRHFLFGHAFACALAAALLLPGCAAWRGGGDGAGAPDEQQAASKAADDKPSAPPAFDIRVELADEKLRTLIKRHNELQRYRAVADLDDGELARLMALAGRDVRNLLGAQGYFSPTVTLTLEQATDAAPGARPTVVIAIDPGAQATVRAVRIGFEGDIAQSADPDAQAQRQAIVDGWGLPQGRHFTQDDWADAKTSALRQLVERRYPRGQISYSVADVDTAQSEVTLDVRLDSGPPFRLGEAAARGAQRYPDWLPERLSWLKPGSWYDQKKLVEAQQRLAGSGYYDSAYVSIDQEGDPDAAPVTYAVTEAKHQKAQIGLGYSTDSGVRLSLEHRHNAALGTSWRADTKLNLDRKAPLLQTGLTSLPNADGWRRALFARHMRQDDGSLVTTSQTLKAGVVQNTAQYDRNFYLQYDRAQVSGSASVNVPDALVGDGAAISANFAWTGRYFDSMPVPKRGYGLQTDVGVGMTTMGPRQPFARLTGRWLGLLPLGGSGSGSGSSGGGSRLALRAEIGAVAGARDARLPGTYLFRTGGDTTVRGYSWRSIGIPLGGKWVGPGRYMALGSVEWQRPVLQERFPGLLEHTVFIDTGSVANHINDMRAHWGVGTGVRLITPVGPMELAVARGLQPKQWRLHMTVGFTF